MRESKMAVMPVCWLLLNMVWPMMLPIPTQTLYNLADSMFVTQLSSDRLVVLVLVYPIQTLMIAVCVGTGVGSNALLARRLGRGRSDEASRVAANGYFIYLVHQVIFLALGVGLTPVFVELFAPGQSQVIDYGIQYLFIVTGASVGICMQFVGEHTPQTAGNTVGPMVIQGIGAVINLILDPLLTFGIGSFPRVEVAGVALATVLGQVIGIMVELCMVRRSSIVRLSFRGFCPDSAIIRTMSRVGVPTILVQALAMVMNLGMNLTPPLFTTSGVLILGVYFKPRSFLFMSVNGLNNALIPIVSFNYGVWQHSRTTGATYFALVLPVAITAVGTAVFLAILGPLLRLLDADVAVLAEGTSALRLITLSFVYVGMLVILCAAFQALGVASSSLVVSLLRQFVLFFPPTPLLGAPRPSLAWLAFLLSEGAACLATLLLCRRTARGRLAGMEE